MGLYHEVFSAEILLHQAVKEHLRLVKGLLDGKFGFVDLSDKGGKLVLPCYLGHRDSHFLYLREVQRFLGNPFNAFLYLHLSIWRENSTMEIVAINNFSTRFQISDMPLKQESFIRLHYGWVAVRANRREQDVPYFNGRTRYEFIISRLIDKLFGIIG